MNAITIAIIAGVLVAIVFAVLYMARRAMVAFDIRIRDGKSHLRSGAPSAAFLSDVQEIAERNAISRATILGVRKRRGMQILFYGPISANAQQQVRNAWSVLR
jgi:hypothetical protein